MDIFWNYTITTSPPENEALEDQPTEDFTDSQDDDFFFLRADIFSYGQVVAYTLTEKMPWHGSNSLSVAGIQNNMIQSLDQVEIPEELSGKLRSVIHDCRLEDPKERPTADRLVQDYFKGKAIILLIFIISANEIPGELSRENLISSHVKIT